MVKSDNICTSILDNIAINYKMSEDKLFVNNLVEISNECISAFIKGKKLLVCGNGGSASDAQHMVAELIGRFKIERKGLYAISLNSNTSSITAIANDYSYEEIFSRQVDAIANEGDILIGISTSGHSKNILNAFKIGYSKNLICIGLTGKDGYKDNINCKYVINIPSNDTPRIQEAHIMIIHILCDLIEKGVFKGDKE